MIGTDANGHPDSFWQADLAEATRRLVAIVREARPAVDRQLRRERQLRTSRPYQRGPDRPRRVPRLGRRAVGGIALLRDRLGSRALGRADDDHEGARDRAAMGPRRASPMAARELNRERSGAARSRRVEPRARVRIEFGRADAEVTTRVDVSGHLDAKRRSMDCHRTQRQDLGWLLDLPEDLADGASRPSTTCCAGWTAPTCPPRTARPGCSGSRATSVARATPVYAYHRGMSNRTLNLTDDLVAYVHRYGVREHPVLAALRERTAPLPSTTCRSPPSRAPSWRCWSG